MKISKERRKEIEKAWIKESVYHARGVALCNFISKYCKELKPIWSDIWVMAEKATLPSYYLSESDENYATLSYLCRALSLNMLLDDNEE